MAMVRPFSIAGGEIQGGVFSFFLLHFEFLPVGSQTPNTVHNVTFPDNRRLSGLGNLWSYLPSSTLKKNLVSAALPSIHDTPGFRVAYPAGLALSVIINAKHRLKPVLLF